MPQRLVTTMIICYNCSANGIIVVDNCDQLVLNDNKYLTWTVLSNLIYIYLIIYVV